MAESMIKRLTIPKVRVETGISGLAAFKCGDVRMLCNNSTDKITASVDETVWTLPSELCPSFTIDFVDAYAKKRFWVLTSGAIVAKDAVSNSYIRFTITYL